MLPGWPPIFLAGGIEGRVFGKSGRTAATDLLNSRSIDRAIDRTMDAALSSIRRTASIGAAPGLEEEQYGSRINSFESHPNAAKFPAMAVRKR